IARDITHRRRNNFLVYPDAAGGGNAILKIMFGKSCKRRFTEHYTPDSDLQIFTLAGFPRCARE
ncbi:MAG TPA: hypothetical protein VFR24_17770, partial [Candidatus Angelobacter sp.]|nr:hypothetical protein [Candidatus Angelobacter sp.]